MRTPSNDQQWFKDFSAAARKLKFAPSAVNDAMDVVESHCADSKESAFEAFGDPAEYAASLPLTAVPIDWRLGVTAGAGTIAPLLSYGAARPFATGALLEVTLGMTIFGIGLMAVCAVVHGRGTGVPAQNAAVPLMASIFTGSVLFQVMNLALPLVVLRLSPISLASWILLLLSIGPVSALSYSGKRSSSARVYRSKLLALPVFSLVISLSAFGAGLLVHHLFG